MMALIENPTCRQMQRGYGLWLEAKGEVLIYLAGSVEAMVLDRSQSLDRHQATRTEVPPRLPGQLVVVERHIAVSLVAGETSGGQHDLIKPRPFLVIALGQFTNTVPMVFHQ